jgi:excinuclease UvrABC nuclease subunit
MSRNKEAELSAEYGFVYMFYKDSNWPVYVGRTITPIDRLSAHFRNVQSYKKTLEDMHEIELIRIAWVGSSKESYELEAGLISKYAPELNSQLWNSVPNSYWKWDETKYKWVSFTPTEFLKDKTIAYRCLTIS